MKHDDFETYRGTTPVPPDFDAFWQERMVEADQALLRYGVQSSTMPPSYMCEYLDLQFHGLHGEKLYAKYLRPRTQQTVPLVLQFHGYPGGSRSWFALSSFVGMGFAVLVLECPGQGGRSEDFGSYMGTTVAGHLVAGLDGPPKDMYYVRLYQNIRILCRIVAQLEEVNKKKIYVYGASQGGGLGIACAALNADLIHKAAILYPFLSDFQKIWEMNADEKSYEGLRYYSRWFDPDGRYMKEKCMQLGYFDALHFAPWVRCEVLFGTGLSDVVCPPITQFAVYHRLKCAKKHLIYPGLGHEEIEPFDDAVLSFFLQEESAK